jgi:hypothetical protein
MAPTVNPERRSIPAPSVEAFPEHHFILGQLVNRNRIILDTSVSTDRESVSGTARSTPPEGLNPPC